MSAFRSTVIAAAQCCSTGNHPGHCASASCHKVCQNCQEVLPRPSAPLLLLLLPPPLLLLPRPSLPPLLLQQQMECGAMGGCKTHAAAASAGGSGAVAALAVQSKTCTSHIPHSSLLTQNSVIPCSSPHRRLASRGRRLLPQTTGAHVFGVWWRDRGHTGKEGGGGERQQIRRVHTMLPWAIGAHFTWWRESQHLS